MKKVLNQLSNIFLIEYNGTKRFTKALTKTQRKILTLFGADKTILKHGNQVSEFSCRYSLPEIIFRIKLGSNRHSNISSEIARLGADLA